MRLTRIYTKIGDQGKTSIVSGDMVPKSDSRIEAYGTVDELNASVGLFRDSLAAHSQELFCDLITSLAVIQNELFDLGGELATPHEFLNVDRQQVVTMENVTRLEQGIDAINEMIPPLENFILPGGHVLISLCHMTRTICRRAERRLEAFRQEQTCRIETLIYLNRLSDWLFVVARDLARQLDIKEVLWKQNKK
jgi:cob(I)alamin adenosyltransferase